MDDGGFDLLTAYVDATPTEAEVDLLQRARGFVVSLGVYLPRHEVTWFRAAPGLPDQGFTHPRSAPVQVQLRIGLTPRDLVAVILHELWHVADSRNRDLLVSEFESRAERFQGIWTDRACRALGVR